MFNKNYELIEDSPAVIEWDKYCNEVLREYKGLLQDYAKEEKEFQLFFEKNPSLIQGALEIFGHSGHYPFMNTLISQPKIGNIITRFPDFLWLAQDSLNFCPVFIEIESPAKKMFTTTGNTTAEFNHAMQQIREWKNILKKPVNINLFYEYYNIPKEMQDKEFNPQFLLIFGRRSEYDNDEKLRGLRAENKLENVDIFSYDRLRPIYDFNQFTCTTVKEAKYYIKSIPPTFRYRPSNADVLYKYKGFYEAIDNMEKTSDERIEFLKSRYEYWVNFGKSGCPGLIAVMDSE